MRGADKGVPNLPDRFARALREELAGLDARRVGASIASRALPQLSFNRLRTRALRRLGVRLGPGSLVMGHLRITGIGDVRELLSFGDGVVVTGPLHVDIGGRIEVGDHVYIGHDVALLSVDHEIATPGRRCGDVACAPIRVGNGTWIAARATVLGGVTIGRGAVVAAGAVVTRDVAENALVGGAPARLLRMLSADWETRDIDVHHRS